MSEIDNSELTPADPNVNDNLPMYQRPDREKHLSLKASESFELKQKKTCGHHFKTYSKN